MADVSTLGILATAVLELRSLSALEISADTVVVGVTAINLIMPRAE